MKRFLLLFSCFLATLNLFAQSFPPLPPSSLSAGQVGLTNVISASWTAPSGTITGYKVYFSSPSDPLDSVSTTTTSASLNNLIFNQNYTITVKSFRSTAPGDTVRSIASGSVNVLVVSLVAPTPSVDLNNVTRNSLILGIADTNQNETGFDIELDQGGVITNLTEGSGTNIFKLISNLLPKKLYGIRVRARYNALAGPWSAVIFAQTKVDFPPAIVLSSDSNCPDLIHLVWSIPSRSEDVEQILLKKSYDGVTFQDMGNIPLTDVGYWDQTTRAGSTQYYALFTRNSTGTTSSNVVSVTALAYVKPNPALNPISDQGNKSRNHLTIRWTNGAEDKICKTNIRTNTIIMIKVNNTGDYKEYTNLPGFASSVKIENLSPKDIVDVAIFAVSDKGLFSNPTYIRDTTAGPPYTPTNPIAILYYDALGNPAHDISWKDNSKDEDYFIVERSTDNINFSVLGKIKMDINSFKDLTPDEATIYYYRVKAGSNTEGESSYSTVIGPFIINPKIAPNKPYGLKAIESASKVNLKWYDDSKREENYIIEKSQDGGASYVLVATLGKNITSYTDENVSAGKTYQYRVFAKNAIGSSGNSNVATIKMSGTGIAPSLLSLTVFPNPTFENLNIKVEDLKIDSEYNLAVFDRNNRQIISTKIQLRKDETFVLPFNNLSQGLYNIVISNGESSTAKKIFKY
jgi:hypothetical protein